MLTLDFAVLSSIPFSLHQFEAKFALSWSRFQVNLVVANRGAELVMKMSFLCTIQRSVVGIFYVTHIRLAVIHKDIPQ